jgi:hypothetical protein
MDQGTAERIRDLAQWHRKFAALASNVRDRERAARLAASLEKHVAESEEKHSRTRPQ